MSLLGTRIEIDHNPHFTHKHPATAMAMGRYCIPIAIVERGNGKVKHFIPARIRARGGSIMVISDLNLLCINQKSPVLLQYDGIGIDLLADHNGYGEHCKGLWLEPFTNRLAVGGRNQSTASLTV